MNKHFFYLASVLIFCACSSANKEPAADSSRTDSVQKISTDSSSFLAPPQDTVTDSKGTEFNFSSIEEFPAEWVRLTEIENELLVYNPCMSSNPTMSIQATDTTYELIHNLGQMAEIFTVKEIQRKGDQEYWLICTGQYEGEQTAVVKMVDTKNGLARWNWFRSGQTIDPAAEGNLYVVKENTVNYREESEECNYEP